MEMPADTQLLILVLGNADDNTLSSLELRLRYYVADKESEPVGQTSLKYRKYDYGPRAKRWKRILSAAKRDELINERRTPTFGSVRRRYMLTEMGETAYESIHNVNPEFAESVESVLTSKHDYTKRQLIEYIKNEYPSWYENSVYLQ